MDYIEDIAVKRMQKVIGKTVKKDDELLESLDFDAGGITLPFFSASDKNLFLCGADFPSFPNTILLSFNNI
jgi:hypothetical protein